MIASAYREKIERPPCPAAWRRWRLRCCDHMRRQDRPFREATAVHACDRERPRPPRPLMASAGLFSLLGSSRGSGGLAKPCRARAFRCAAWASAPVGHVHRAWAFQAMPHSRIRSETRSNFPLFAPQAFAGWPPPRPRRSRNPFRPGALGPCGLRSPFRGPVGRVRARPRVVSTSCRDRRRAITSASSDVEPGVKTEPFMMVRGAEIAGCTPRADQRLHRPPNRARRRRHLLPRRQAIGAQHRAMAARLDLGDEPPSRQRDRGERAAAAMSAPFPTFSASCRPPVQDRRRADALALGRHRRADSRAPSRRARAWPSAAGPGPGRCASTNIGPAMDGRPVRARAAIEVF